ncbi:amino acid ABC transporter substrate-binding protein [Variovorax sp. J22G21]|uniref:amino acid ABC transporter substrate-binding protein n=1 Tax=Variovorax fucosicus TaxID=3053517 RepID=UPI002574F1F2|nr:MULTISPECIES: amino acid ABC transporter substrate-binding protein [unclassified Variovorax]MDM0042615.1 amino acid ABC transporter substrate-binding protein [Variovorax sp. J22R193]MDM0061220.1 amino acid ABC transporter substrate-binding protein [Variovorax sp. J22G21]
MRPLASQLRLVPLLALALACAAHAQSFDALSGTLKKVKESGTITLGVREASFPFSYTSRTGRPIGYSIDLCERIVEGIRSAIDAPELQVRHELLRSEERLPAVKSGRVDLECGSTTNTQLRQQEVAFSPVIFVTGTKLLVRRGAGIASFHQMKGKTVVVSTGTTNEAAIRSLSAKQALNLTILVRPDLQQAFDAFQAGQADAFATDDVLQYGFVARAKAPRGLSVVGDYLSFEPYGIVYRKDDPQLAQVVNQTFGDLAKSREISWIYDKWFVRRLPDGERLGMPMNPQLTTIFEALGLPP